MGGWLVSKILIILFLIFFAKALALQLMLRACLFMHLYVRIFVVFVSVSNTYWCPVFGSRIRLGKPGSISASMRKLLSWRLALLIPPCTGIKSPDTALRKTMFDFWIGVTFEGGAGSLPLKCENVSECGLKFIHSWPSRNDFLSYIFLRKHKIKVYLIKILFMMEN